MAYADKCYVGKRVKLELLSQDDVKQIHEATLDVIENVGVKFHSQNALDILEANGASVDRETTVAKIPAAAVEKAMSTVPHEFTLGARNPEYDLPLDGEHVYISSDGCGVFYRDPASGEVRSSRKEDLENCAKVVQALDNVSATSAVVSAQDCPTSTRVLHEFDACVRSSEKHNIVVSIKEDWEARSLIKMAEALAGGTEELKRRPMFTAIICTVSPLHQERFGMDLALVLAEAGIRVSFYPMPILGATGPITIAGSAVVNNAEFLSGATLVQLARGPAAEKLPGPHGGLLRPAGLVRRRRHHRQGARHPERLRERPRDVHGLRERRRRDLRHRPARRLAHPLPREHGRRRRDHRHGQAHPYRHRGERGDAGRRPHQEDGVQRQLPLRQPHPQARPRAVAGKARRDRQLRRLEAV